eukprot:gene10058-7028_t
MYIIFLLLCLPLPPPSGGGQGSGNGADPGRIKSATLRRPLTPKYDPRDPVSAICFLSNMSKNFEEQENYLEAVKCAESALLLRKKNFEVIQEALKTNEDLKAIHLPFSITDQANNLVTLCNTYAVCEFNVRRFDAASHFLSKALFLTDNAVEKTPGDLSYTVKKMTALSGKEKEEREQLPQEEEIATLCFVNDDASRLRQRAATYNNLGCMERRRNLLPEALDYFKKAAQIEVRVDPHGLGSPSTYLNMCTVLNEMKRYPEAVPAAERAISSLQMLLPEQTTEEDLSNTAMMLAVGQYNLGVSLEKRGKAGDAQAAEKAYQLSLDTSRRYLLGTECPTVSAAISAIKRMKVPRLAVEMEKTNPETGPSVALAADQQQHVSPNAAAVPLRQQGSSLQPQQASPPAHRAAETPTPPQVYPSLQQPLLENPRNVFQPPAEQRPDPMGAAEAQYSRPGQIPPGSQQQSPFQAQQQQQMLYPPPRQPTPSQQPSPMQSDPYQQEVSSYAPTAPIESRPSTTPHSREGRNSGSQNLHGSQSGQRSSPHMGEPQPAHPSGSQYVSRSPHLAGSQPAMGSQRLSGSEHIGRSQLLGRRSGGGSPVVEQISPMHPGGSQVLEGSVHSRSSKDLLRPPRAGPLPPPPVLDPVINASGEPVKPLTSTPSLRDMPHLALSQGSNSVQSAKSGGDLRRSGGGSVQSRSDRGGSQSLATAEDEALRQSISSISRSQPLSSSVARQKMERSRGGDSANVRGLFGRRHGSISGASRGSLTSAIVPRNNSIGSRVSMKSKTSVEEKKVGLLQNNRMHEKAQAVARRQKEKEMAEYDALLAEQMCESMVKGIREDQVRRCHRAAVAIQRVWRGVMARMYILTMMTAVKKLQPAIRRYLIKARIQHKKEEEERLRREEEQRRKELAAARFLQARVRQFIRRLNIRREFIARQRRNYFAARTIQRAYRDFCTRRAEHLAAIAEAHRREDEQQRFREKVAARHIQKAYRQYKILQKGRVAAEENQKQQTSAIIIQALVRGVLTRAWFRYYRAYRRDQELRSAESIKAITLIQAACRTVQSQQHVHEQHSIMVSKIRNRHIHDAATKIQTFWRQHVAKIHFERLKADRDRLHRTATRLQRWYRTRVLRNKFLKWREEQRRAAAATAIQQWVRQLWQLRKEKEFAMYHADLLRKQRLMRLQEESATLLQACCKAIASIRIVKERAKAYVVKCQVAKTLQRICRGYVDRKVVAIDKVIAKKLERQEFELALKTACARVIQRAWRCAMAKDKVEQMRREDFAARVISRSYRVYKAKKELAELKAERQAKIEEKAACVIQRRVRNFLKCVKFAQIEAYYKEQHKKKMWRMRRAEAAVMIQSVWRGHCTRKAVAIEKAALAELAVFAIKIQRAWRHSKEKVKIKERADMRQVFIKAALVIQCFWRKMAAADRVAAMRTHRRLEIASAIKIQSWWRMMLAKRILHYLRLEQLEEDRVAAIYAAKWEKAVTVINAFLRTRADQQNSLGRLRHYLINQLTDKEREAFLKRHTAAVKIQAAYRGFYERAVARYLRKEKAEQDRLKAEQAAKEVRAATRLQCCYRRYRAKKELRRRIMDKRQAIVENQEDFIASNDPHDIVRELFWVHNAINRKEKAQRVVADNAVTQKAATVIQQAYRIHRARRDAYLRKLAQKSDGAARVIQQHWRNHHNYVTARDEKRKLAAALLIQCHVRGWMVRRVWRQWRDACEEQHRQFFLEEEKRDRAVTAIQSVWRRINAERLTEELREQREEVFIYNATNEAASIIQNAFRSHYERLTAMQTARSYWMFNRCFGEEANQENHRTLC